MSDLEQWLQLSSKEHGYWLLDVNSDSGRANVYLARTLRGKVFVNDLIVWPMEGDLGHARKAFPVLLDEKVYLFILLGGENVQQCQATILERSQDGIDGSVIESESGPA